MAGGQSRGIFPDPASVTNHRAERPDRKKNTPVPGKILLEWTQTRNLRDINIFTHDMQCRRRGGWAFSFIMTEAGALRS